MKEGGCALEHRAPAGLVACWSRTHGYVRRHAGLSSSNELLQCHERLATELQEGAVAVWAHVPQLFAVPWEHGDVPNFGIKQKQLMAHFYARVRKSLLATMSDHDAAVLRSCGGPGGGGFLLQQGDPKALMDDDRFKVAMAQQKARDYDHQAVNPCLAATRAEMEAADATWMLPENMVAYAQ